MKEEKKSENLLWLSYEGLKFRIKKEDEAIIWVAQDDADVGYSMVIYDFLDHCNEELNLTVKLDKTWHGWTGFIVEGSEVDFLLGEMVNFIEEWEMVGTQRTTISQEEWYSG